MKIREMWFSALSVQLATMGPKNSFDASVIRPKATGANNELELNCNSNRGDANSQVFAPIFRSFKARFMSAAGNTAYDNCNKILPLPKHDS